MTRLQRRSLILGLSMLPFALIGLGLTLQILVCDLPIYLGTVLAHGPDPGRPGHTRGIVVTSTELFTRCLTGSGALIVAGWLFVALRKLAPEEEAT
ncbi:hypothetical protein EON79_06445 [bacterium]|nr:MAG: hypothetical protein EON79_06445 [bacterium]